ncbi:MAG: hypoxanthine/guanine phosphoribosyltransferase [Thermoplasmata archaeon]
MLEKLEDSMNNCPAVKMNDYYYFIHPITDGLPLVDPELLEEVVEAVVQVANMNCDYILTAQSMGFPLAAALSLKTGLPYKYIRKRSYGLENEISIDQVTGYGSSDMYINFVEKGDKVLLVDDVLSTGGTLRSIAAALKNIGVEIVDIVIVFEKVGVREDLERELGLNIKTLLKLEMDGKDIKVISKGV